MSQPLSSVPLVGAVRRGKGVVSLCRKKEQYPLSGPTGNMTARSLRSFPQSLAWDVICGHVEGSVVLRRGIAALADRLALDASQQQRPGPSASCAAFSSAPASSSSIYKACVALERLPVLAPEPPAYELSYSAWSASFSYPLFFSVSPLVTRMRADSPDFSLDVSPGTAWNAKRFKRLPSSFVETDAASSSSVGGANGKQQAGSSGSAWAAATRTTAADRANDVRSLSRRLDARLFLLVKRAGGGWGFLEEDIDADSARSSRDVAEAALSALVGSDDEAQVDGAEDREEDAKPAEVGDAFYFVGNAPAAHSEDGKDTTRFYHRCQLVRPDAFRGDELMQRGGFEDFVWVGVDEMGPYLEDKSRVDVLQSMA